MRSFSGLISGIRLVTLIALTLGACFQTASAEVATFEITADEMCCAGCAKKVAAQLYTAPGVTNVTANVAARTVMVTANSHPKLTLEKLWNAVEKGKGMPSRMNYNGVVYTLTRSAAMNADQQSTTRSYALVIADLQQSQSADRIAKVLYGIRGVSKVSVDAANDTLIVEPAGGVAFSPWLLMTAVQQAQAQPLVITGPYGRFTIEAEEPTQVSVRPLQQGESR